MKVGIRTPNVKKSIKAKTTGRVKQSMKKAVNPLYGKSWMMWMPWKNFCMTLTHSLST